jgi:hypothetical protein
MASAALHVKSVAQDDSRTANAFAVFRGAAPCQPSAPRGMPLKLEIPPDPPLLEAAAAALELPRHVQLVLHVLKVLKLQTYFDVLQNNGYDDIRSLYCLTEEDMSEMGFETRHAQRLISWCTISREGAFCEGSLPQTSPYSCSGSAPATPSEEFDYSSMAKHFALTTPGSPPTPCETFTHSPHTFCPYAIVTPSPKAPPSAGYRRSSENHGTGRS